MNKALSVRFGSRVRELRRRKNLSLEALAGRCKLGSTFLQRVETGKQTPSLDSVERIAAGLAIPVLQLFAFDDPAQETRQRLRQQIDKATDQEILRMARILDAALY